jgi:hypothetical protein
MNRLLLTPSLIVMMAICLAPQAQAHIGICNRTENEQTLWVSVVSVEIAYVPNRFHVNYQKGWRTYAPGACGYLTGETSVYIYIDGSKGGIWRSKPGPSDVGFRTFEPPRAYWCVNNGASTTWPNGSQRADAPVNCPKGSRMVWADLLVVAAPIQYTWDIY